MIYLNKGQILLNNPGLVVYSPTGYYEDGDPVICAAIFSPEEPLCRFEAKFIAYGDNVYNITDPERLMEEVEKIDPENLFGKNKDEVAVDKMIEKIKKPVIEEETTEETDEVAEEEGDVLGEESVSEAPSDEVTEPVVEPEPEVVPEEVPPVIEEPVPPVTPVEEVVPVTEEVLEVVPETPVVPVDGEPLSVLVRKRKRRVA